MSILSANHVKALHGTKSTDHNDGQSHTGLISFMNYQLITKTTPCFISSHDRTKLMTTVT